MNKIGVHPMSLGPNEQQVEIFTGFYSLGCLMAYAKVHEAGALCESFDFGRITPRPPSRIPGVLDDVSGDPGVFLLSSYVWNHDINMKFVAALKRRSPDSMVIVGGPHIPRAPGPCEEFFAKNPGVDVAVRHDGELTLAGILSEIRRAGVEPADLLTVDLSHVEGLTFRRDGGLVRTVDRGRIMDLSIYPSPYTTGEFDHWIDDNVYLPVESNRGCPYGCTFCDWGAATLSKIAKMSMERVFAEVEFSARHRINLIGFCDANFGILARDVDIVRHIIDVKNRYGYPREVGYTNAKTANPRLTEIIKLLHDGGLIATGQISMQTTDEQILENVARTNIKMSEYRKMITFFHKEEIPAVSDIMLGLPGQTFDTCKKDLQFCFDHKVLAVIFATSVMPNAPMADEEYQRKFQITVGDDGFVESTYSFTREEYARMFDLCLAYKLFVRFGVLRYLMYFVQIEHGVPAMDFLGRWLTESVAHPERYPISARIVGQLLERDRRGGLKDWLLLIWTDQQAAFLFDGMDAFQAEIVAFLEREHGVRLDGSDAQAVLVANREVMPKKGRALPAQVPLAHDVAGYFSALRALPRVDTLPADRVPLKAFGPGYIDLQPSPAPVTYQSVDMNPLVGRLELESNLRI